MDETTIKCDNCEEEFTDEESYESHRELSHENDSFQFIDSRDAVDEQEFVRINGKREYNPNPNAGLYDNKLFREGSAKERTSILGEHYDGTDHEHPHEEANEFTQSGGKWYGKWNDLDPDMKNQVAMHYRLGGGDSGVNFEDLSEEEKDEYAIGYVLQLKMGNAWGVESKANEDDEYEYGFIPKVSGFGEDKDKNLPIKDHTHNFTSGYQHSNGIDYTWQCSDSGCGATKNQDLYMESKATEVDGYTVLDKDGDETPSWYESDNLSDAKREADRVSGSVIEVPSFGGVIDKEAGNIVYRSGEAKATERQPSDGNDYWKNTYILPTGDDAYARCTICGADVDTLTTDGDWMSDKEMLDHYDDHVSRGQIMLYGESLDEEQSEDYLEARDELIAGAIGSEKLGSKNPFKIGNEFFDTYTCTNCGKVGTDFGEMVKEICPEGNGGGHVTPILGDESIAKEYNQEIDPSDEEEVFQILEDEGANYTTGIDQLVYVIQRHTHYDNEDATKLAEKWQSIRLGRESVNEVDCPKCSGNGIIGNKMCSYCDGEGQVSEIKALKSEYGSDEWVDHISSGLPTSSESYAKEDDYQHNFGELTSLAQDKIEDGGISQDTWDGSSKEERKDIESELHGESEDVDYEKEDELSAGFIEQQHTEPKEDKNKDLDDVDISLEKIDYIYPTKVGEAKKKSYITEAIDGLDEEYDHEKESDSEEIVEMVTSRKMSGYSDESIARELHITYGVDPDYARNRVYGIEVSTNDKVANTFFGKMYKDCTESEKDELKMYSGSDY